MAQKMLNTINYEPFVSLQLHVQKQKLIRKSSSICHKTLKNLILGHVGAFLLQQTQKRT